MWVDTLTSGFMRRLAFQKLCQKIFEAIGSKCNTQELLPRDNGGISGFTSGFKPGSDPLECCPSRQKRKLGDGLISF